MNPRSSGYEPDELPDFSTPQLNSLATFDTLDAKPAGGRYEDVVPLILVGTDRIRTITSFEPDLQSGGFTRTQNPQK